MSTVATLRADLIGSSAQFRTEMVRGQRQANQSLGKIQKEAMATREAIVGMTRAAAGFIGFEAVRRGVGSLLDAQVKMQAIHYTLLAATGSARQAGDAFAFVQQEAEKLGLSLEPTAEGFAKLSASATALNVPMSQQKDLFDAFAKASTTLHLSTENSNRALLALEQMFAKGKIQAQELRLQLGQAIPGAAARFQQAVLQMTKGTDLAGKSFDQLLKQGLLYTDQFLPALVQSLQESSRGWEDASESLNAQLNRLKTAWFQLRVETSNGLFNDVATESVKLMASNLDKLASAAGIAGSVLAARFAGKGFAALAGGVVQLKGLTAARIADAQATTVQAERELALASANAARTAAARTKSAALKASLEQTLRTDLGEKERIATLNRLGKVTARMVGENIAYRDSLASLATAQRAAAVSEAELSAARSASVLGRAAKGIGSFALGLVGGPWGAAILGVGAVGYAIYKLVEHQKEEEAQTRKMVATTAGLVSKFKDLKDALDDIHTSVQVSTVFDNAISSVKHYEQELQRLHEKQAKQQQNHIDTNVGTPGSFTAAAISNLVHGDLSPQIKNLTRDTEQFKQTAQEAARAALNMLPPGKADELVSKIQGMTFGWNGASTALQKFQLIAQYMPQTLQNIVSSLSKQQKAASDYENTLDALIAKSKKYIDTHGQSAAQKIAYDTAQIIQNNPDLSARDITQLALKSAEAQRAAMTEDSLKREIDARKKAITASKQQATAYASIQNSQEAQIQTLNAELAGSTKVSAAQKKLNLMLAGGSSQFRKLSKSEQAETVAKQRQIVALTKQKKAQDEAKKSAEALAIVQKELSRISGQYRTQWSDQLAGIGLGQKERDRLSQQREVSRRYDQQISKLDERLSRGDISQSDYQKGVQEAEQARQATLTGLQNYYQQADALQADWRNGVRSGLMDVADSWSDYASQAHDAVTSAFNGMADSLADFVVTGKGNFKDLTISILKDLERMAIKIAASRILMQIVGSMVGGSGGYSGIGGYSGASTSYAGYAANGAAFTVGGRRAFASGGIVNRPTKFAFAGGTGLMGEAGPEAIMPLKRGADGKLGVRVSGGTGGDIIINTTVNVENGTATSDTDSRDGNKAARQLAAMMESTAKQVVVRATQPGGILWKQRNGVPA